MWLFIGFAAPGETQYSAIAQLYINHKDNPGLNHCRDNKGLRATDCAVTSIVANHNGLPDKEIYNEVSDRDEVAAQ